MKKVIITGINGQDGSYLSEYLSEKGLRVFGLIRRNSSHLYQTSRLEHLTKKKKIELIYGDLIDETSIDNVVTKIKPDYLFNLGAQSHVKISFDIPKFTYLANSQGVLNILESVRKNSKKTRIYQASSSEMFGVSVDKDGYQRETTKFDPNSPYGCSKVSAYHLARFYRRAYKMFVANGILFNHESPRRGTNFVTNKIVRTAVRIKLGLEKKLILGNLNSFRDWGHAKDYVKAMYLIIKNNKPDDFVIATGQNYSIQQFCKIVFSKLNLNYKNYITSSQKYFRPGEVPYLKGDASKAMKVLGWKPSYDIYTLIDEMVDYWSNYYNNTKYK